MFGTGLCAYIGSARRLATSNPVHFDSMARRNAEIYSKVGCISLTRLSTDAFQVRRITKPLCRERVALHIQPERDWTEDFTCHAHLLCRRKDTSWTVYITTKANSCASDQYYLQLDTIQVLRIGANEYTRSSVSPCTFARGHYLCTHPSRGQCPTFFNSRVHVYQ